MLDSFHYALLVVDIERFGRRSDVDQQWLRDQLRQVLRRVCAESGVPHDELAWQDTGDGGFFLVPASLPKRLLVDPFVVRLHAALREHNGRASGDGRLRLRVALHAGEVATDTSLDGRAGYVGRDLNFACRLVDAAALRERLAAHPQAQLVFAVSDVIHQAVIRRGDGAIDPSGYTPFRLQAKEVDETAWVHVPGVVEPAAPAAPVPPDAQRREADRPGGPAVTTDGGVSISGSIHAGNDVVMRDKIEYHR